MNEPTKLDQVINQAESTIRNQIKEMAGLVERALQSSLQAFLTGSGEVAYSVIFRDQYIDEKEKEIDRLCLNFLVRQQPAAGHLRFVYAAIKINQELERIGDYAESIARQSLILNSLGTSFERGLYEEVAGIAIPMVGAAVTAFIDQDEQLAWKTMESEEQANKVRDKINREVNNLHRQSDLPLEALTALMTVGRRFERVADQCKNICEEVLYLCTGQYMKHAGSEIFRILFVDDKNSSLSQMAEAIANAQKLENFHFSSAGIDPEPVVPQTVEFCRNKQIDISDQIAKSIDQIPDFEHYHVIVALSESAQRVFPRPPTRTVSLFWQVEDPAESTKAPESSPESIAAAHESTFQFLENQIKDLAHALMGERINPKNLSEKS